MQTHYYRDYVKAEHEVDRLVGDGALPWAAVVEVFAAPDDDISLMNCGIGGQYSWGLFVVDTAGAPPARARRRRFRDPVRDGC